MKKTTGNRWIEFLTFSLFCLLPTTVMLWYVGLEMKWHRLLFLLKGNGLFLREILILQALREILTGCIKKNCIKIRGWDLKNRHSETLPCPAAGTWFHHWVLGREQFSRKTAQAEKRVRVLAAETTRPGTSLRVVKERWQESPPAEMPACTGKVALVLL